MASSHILETPFSPRGADVKELLVEMQNKPNFDVD